MPWVDRQYIFKPSGEHGWMNTHAQVPVVLVMEDRYRVYLSTRKIPTESRIAIVDLEIDDPTRIIKVHADQAVLRGNPGTFDEFGVMPAAVVRNGKNVNLYTTGWQRGQTVPYLNAVGLAISEDDGLTFRKPYEGPVVSPTKDEPFSAMSPFILKENGVWRMWYSSGVGWHRGPEKYEPIYLIKYAYSGDGLNWNQPNITCIAGTYPEEAITRPSVVRDESGYHMWFCSRGSEDFRGGTNSFRIGYAFSNDGLSWVRDDSRGLAPSGSGWDSTMTAYPYVVETPNMGLAMFYCGDYFGKEGFGVAYWRDN